MGYAYLFALIVGLGILVIQTIIGAKDGADKDIGAHKDIGVDAEADDAHGDAHDKDTSAVGGFVALFLSLRFWVFAFLGFGLSGSLLHYLTGVGVLPTAITALVLGLSSGLGAAAAFRALRRSASRTAEHTGEAAVGRVGRVIVACPEKGVGKVRIEVAGQTVDLLARSSGLRIERGDEVLIEEVDGEIVRVSRAPEEVREQ